MLYNTGTIAINGNTATGTGTNWTAPVSQVRAGQTIIVMSNPVQMFQISSVNSATSLTVTPAASPALNGQKYGILVSDIISVDGLAQAMSQLINEYDENIGAWETFATTSTNQTITVTINGASVTIPGIGGMARKGANSDITQLTGLTTALSVAQGGTGAKTKEDARTNLGLGTSATTDSTTSQMDATTGRSLKVGDWGIGTTSAPIVDDANNARTCGIYSPGGATGANWADAFYPALVMNRGNNYIAQIQVTASGYLASRRATTTLGWTAWATHWNDKNTTVDTNGFIKRASPIVKLHGTGEVECNEEAEGVTVFREGVGVYRVRGSNGLHPEGWTVEIPQDINGNFLCFVDITTADDGVLTVSVFHRRFDIETAMVVAGDPVDIPDGRWIDLRLQMPADSLYNQKLGAVELALNFEEAE